jgi:hypothetical protein
MKKTSKDKVKATKKRIPRPEVLSESRNSVKTLEFENLHEAWAGVNEYLLKEEKEIWARGGGIYGPEMVSYNNYIIVRNCKMDPNFDFGTILGYSDKKWSSLKNNYLDMDYLDLVKSEVNSRQGKNAKSYNYSYHFKNFHGSGKDCLISLVFTKRIDNPVPIVVFTVRVSEVTKRLPFDFLLIQRMVEYVYGYDQRVELHMFAPSFYIAGEAVLMYNNYRSIRKVLKPYKGHYGRFQKKVLKTYRAFMKPEALNMTFKTFLRTAEQIQKREDGTPVSGVIPMYAHELQLFKPVEAYPEDMVSPKERTAFRKKFGTTKRKPRGKRIPRA